MCRVGPTRGYDEDCTPSCTACKWHDGFVVVSFNHERQREKIEKKSKGERETGTEIGRGRERDTKRRKSVAKREVKQKRDKKNSDSESIDRMRRVSNRVVISSLESTTREWWRLLELK